MTSRKLSSDLTLYQIRQLRKKYQTVVRQTDVRGVIRIGKSNPSMNELRKLGYYKFVKESGEGYGENYNPRWQMTDTGRSVLLGESSQ